MTEKYAWKKGYRGRTGDINLVRKELQAIENRDGNISAEAVVERARPENSILHRYFDWDDAQAAEKYRLTQARHLINMIVVEFKKGNSEPLVTRAFVEIREEHYRSFSVVVKDNNLRAQLIQQAQEDIEIFTAKYIVLSEIIKLLEPVKEKLKELVNS